jgi:hypothetical protein
MELHRVLAGGPDQTAEDWAPQVSILRHGKAQKPQPTHITPDTRVGEGSSINMSPWRLGSRGLPPGRDPKRIPEPAAFMDTNYHAVAVSQAAQFAGAIDVT